jgi:xylulokinase
VEARAVGGGARSPVWNGIKADVLGVPYQRLGRSELGTWGSALIAGKAAGLFSDLAQKAAESALPEGEPVRPDPENRAIYQRLVEEYIRLQESLTGYFTQSSGQRRSVRPGQNDGVITKNNEGRQFHREGTIESDD